MKKSTVKRLGLIAVLLLTVSCGGKSTTETVQPTETPLPSIGVNPQSYKEFIKTQEGIIFRYSDRGLDTGFETQEEPTAIPTLAITPIPTPRHDEVLHHANDAARTALAGQLQVSKRSMDVLYSEEVVWPNSSLGCPQNGVMYAEVMVPGFQIIVKYENDSYPVHTNRAGSRIVVCIEGTGTHMYWVKDSYEKEQITPTVTQTSTLIPTVLSNHTQDFENKDPVPSYIKNAWLCTSSNVSEVDDLSTSQIETWKCAVSIEYNSDNMVITTNGIPNHTFESGLGGPASTQNYRWIIPLNPVANETVVMAPDRGPIAITVTGIPIYGPEEGPGGDAVALHHGYFVEDRQPIELGICGGHSGPGGTYHYHFDANCMHWHSGSSNQWKNILDWNTDLIDDTKHSPVIGFAFDGFVIYGPFGYDKDGILVEMTSSYQLRPDQNGYGGIDDWEYIEGLGHLDECNGILSLVPESQEPIYHYHSTQKNGAGQIGFPYFLLCYKGVPDESNFSTGGLQDNQQPFPQGSRPPPPRSRQER